MEIQTHIQQCYQINSDTHYKTVDDKLPEKITIKLYKRQFVVQIFSLNAKFNTFPLQLSLTARPTLYALMVHVHVTQLMEMNTVYVTRGINCRIVMICCVLVSIAASFIF